jgi:hypothetical protein
MQDFAFAFQCFMLEFWDREDSGRWPKNPSMSPNVSDDPTIMQDLLTELGKIEPNQEAEPWVGHIHIMAIFSSDILDSFALSMPARFGGQVWKWGVLPSRAAPLNSQLLVAGILLLWLMLQLAIDMVNAVR